MGIGYIFKLLRQAIIFKVVAGQVRRIVLQQLTWRLHVSMLVLHSFMDYDFGEFLFRQCFL
jgi:hypothetical protein